VFVVLKILGEEKVSGANRYAMTCNIDNISLTNVFTILQISCLQTNTQTRFANKKDIHIDGKNKLKNQNFTVQLSRASL